MSRTVRSKKSRSMMLSLYGLSGLSFVICIIFILSSLSYILQQLNLLDLTSLLPDFISTALWIGCAILAATPFAGAITFLAISHRYTRLSSHYVQGLRYLGHMPVLLVGPVFLLIFSASKLGIFCTLWFLAVLKLTRRWVKLSRQEKYLNVESMQSLGLMTWQIIYHLYLRKYWHQYIFHSLAVFCSLSLVVTPVICFDYFSPSFNSSLISLNFYKSISLDNSHAAAFAFLFLMIHFARVFFDHLTGFWEVEYG